MIARAPIDPNERCVVTRYERGWALGTGLPVGLKPGAYRITGEGDVNGIAFLQLNGTYICPADICGQASRQQSDRRPTAGVGTAQPI